MQLIHGAARLERRRVPPYSSSSSHQPKSLLRKKTPLYMFMNMMTASSLHLKIHELNNDSILQYPCLENPMDKRAWWAAVHGVAKSRTRLSNFTFTFHFHALEKAMAAHSSVLAWRIPGTGEPGGLPSMGLHRVRHHWSDLAATAAYELIYIFNLSVILLWLFLSLLLRCTEQDSFSGETAQWREEKKKKSKS